MRSQRPSSLPPSLAPRGLSREQSAEYLGVSPSKFSQMVLDGRMPRPIRIDGRVVWDKVELDAAFDALAETNENPWDQALGLDHAHHLPGRKRHHAP